MNNKKGATCTPGVDMGLTKNDQSRWEITAHWLTQYVNGRVTLDRQSDFPIFTLNPFESSGIYGAKKS